MKTKHVIVQTQLSPLPGFRWATQAEVEAFCSPVVRDAENYAVSPEEYVALIRVAGQELPIQAGDLASAGIRIMDDCNPLDAISDESPPIEWLSEDLEIDREKCELLVDRLRAIGTINGDLADMYYAALYNSSSGDARTLARDLGNDALLWLAAYSTPLGADHPSFEDLDQYLTVSSKDD